MGSGEEDVNKRIRWIKSWYRVDDRRYILGLGVM